MIGCWWEYGCCTRSSVVVVVAVVNDEVESTNDEGVCDGVLGLAEVVEELVVV